MNPVFGSAKSKSVDGHPMDDRISVAVSLEFLGAHKGPVEFIIKVYNVTQTL